MLVEENQMEKKGVPALLMTILGLSLAGNIVYLLQSVQHTLLLQRYTLCFCSFI